MRTLLATGEVFSDETFRSTCTLDALGIIIATLVGQLHRKGAIDEKAWRDEVDAIIGELPQTERGARMSDSLTTVLMQVERVVQHGHPEIRPAIES